LRIIICKIQHKFPLPAKLALYIGIIQEIREKVHINGNRKNAILVIQKDWFYGMYPADGNREDATWKKYKSISRLDISPC